MTSVNTVSAEVSKPNYPGSEINTDVSKFWSGARQDLAQVISRYSNHLYDPNIPLLDGDESSLRETELLRRFDLVLFYELITSILSERELDVTGTINEVLDLLSGADSQKVQLFIRASAIGYIDYLNELVNKGTEIDEKGKDEIDKHSRFWSFLCYQDCGDLSFIIDLYWAFVTNKPYYDLYLQSISEYTGISFVECKPADVIKMSRSVQNEIQQYIRFNLPSKDIRVVGSRVKSPFQALNKGANSKLSREDLDSSPWRDLCGCRFVVPFNQLLEIISDVEKIIVQETEVHSLLSSFLNRLGCRLVSIGYINPNPLPNALWRGCNIVVETTRNWGDYPKGGLLEMQFITPDILNNIHRTSAERKTKRGIRILPFADGVDSRPFHCNWSFEDSIAPTKWDIITAVMAAHPNTQRDFLTASVNTVGPNVVNSDDFFSGIVWVIAYQHLSPNQRINEELRALVNYVLDWNKVSEYSRLNLLNIWQRFYIDDISMQKRFYTALCAEINGSEIISTDVFEKIQENAFLKFLYKLRIEKVVVPYSQKDFMKIYSSGFFSWMTRNSLWETYSDCLYESLSEMPHIVHIATKNHRATRIQKPSHKKPPERSRPIQFSHN